MNGMLDIANRIELGQIRAGLVVSCESAREIVDIMIDRLIAEPDMELFKMSLATLTGGSGAAAVLSDRRLLRLRRLHPLRVEAPPPGRGNAHRA